MCFTRMGIFLASELAELDSLSVPANSAEAREQIKLLDTILSKFTDFLMDFGKMLLVAFIIYFVGKKLIHWILKLLKKFFGRTSMDEGVSKFVLSLARASLYGVLFIVVIGKLGIPTSSFIAVIGSAGVTIGLALQGSLSNLAGGLLILLLKPFRVGDYIIVDEFEGNVTCIDIFYTKLLTLDNRFIVLPNGELSNTNLVNVTNEPERRLELFIDVAYAEDLKRVKEVLYRVVSSNKRVLKEEHEIDVFVNSLEASSIQMGVRTWVKTDEYIKLKWELLEQIKETFDAEKISIPFNQLDVNLVK